MSEQAQPFDDAGETLAVIAITLMRIYDVALAQLEVSGDDGHMLADKLNTAHMAGQIVASLPYLDIGPQAADPAGPQEDNA
jgi:hypothetical protein